MMVFRRDDRAQCFVKSFFPPPTASSNITRGSIVGTEHPEDVDFPAITENLPGTSKHMIQYAGPLEYSSTST